MIEDDLLKKWLNNELTAAEKEAFSKQDDYAINQNIIDNAKQFKASHFSKVQDFESFKTAYNNRKTKSTLQWIRPLLKIASALVVGLAVYFSFFNSNRVEAYALATEQTTITLPDLSKVTLNADSKLSYNADSWGTKCLLNLQGEAYFKVAKGQTFTVSTKSGKVTVVGTEFNVKQRDNYFEVICYEGIVKVASGTIIRQLLAGDTYRIINKKFTADKTLDIQPQWTRNRSRFKSVPFAEVINELERQYNVKVTLKNMDATRVFSGTFMHNNLEEALSALTQPMNLAFVISSPNQVLIHGKTN
ncbi:FecR domain-containing protein [Winogradskyella sp.]|nr:FecR domain-containing protein [Winogradskyella sp.]MDC1503776.1 FecR domain-containing protein [Winogradskyella sp.]